MTRFILYLVGVVLIFFFSFFASDIVGAASEALMLCGKKIIPSFFPFLVCSYFVIYSGLGEKLGRFLSPVYKFVFKINGAGCVPYVLGFLGGYPQGALFTVKMYESGSLSLNEASRQIAFVNNSGIFFVLATLGEGLWGNRKVALIVLFSNLLASIFTGITFSFFGDKKEAVYSKTITKKTLSHCVSDSVNTVFLLSGYIVFFFCISKLLEVCNINLFFSNLLMGFGMKKTDADLVVYALLELSGGLYRSKSINIPLISSLVSIGGISVLCQTATVLSGSGISLKYYILGKLLSGGFACIFARILLFFFPVSLAANTSLTAPLSVVSSASPYTFLWFFVVFAAFLVSRIFAPFLLDRKRNIL